MKHISKMAVLITLLPIGVAWGANANRVALAESPTTDSRWTPGTTEDSRTDLTTGAAGSNKKIEDKKSVVDSTDKSRDKSTPRANDSARIETPAPGTFSRSTVMDVQSALNDFGYEVRIDGILGPQTAAALRNFQASRSLATSGLLDSATLTALNVTAEDVQRSPASLDTTDPVTGRGVNREPTHVPDAGDKY